MKELSYAEYSAGVHRSHPQRRVPISGTLELTHRCPLSCSHCYNNLPIGDRQAQERELSLPEYRRLMDEIAEAGCVWLLFTGGEIFARPDFMEIYRYAKQKGFLITLFTNGTMLTPAIVDELREWPPFAIEITLYGYTAETYERLTGLPGSHERCLRGIQLLREAGLPLKLKTVAVSINKHEIADMRRFAEEEVGVGFMYDAMMNPRIDCSHSPLEVRLTPEEVVWLDLEDQRRQEAWARFARGFQAPPANPEQVYSCGGGVGSFAVDPYGRLRLCLLSHQDAFDLRAGSFADGWDDFLGGVRSKRTTRVTKCTRCHLRGMCGMCPANAELHSGGDAETPVDFLCETAHLRAHALTLGVPEHGACEYCAGGERHAALLQSVERLRTSPRSFAERFAAPVAGAPAAGSARRLPVLKSADQGAGCGSCSH